jgi:hypothetical protein
LTRTVYKFTFDDNVPMDGIAKIMALSTIPIESIHGESAMMLDGRFLMNMMNMRRRTCLIDAESQAGNDLARVFTGFLNLQAAGRFSVVADESSDPLGDLISFCGVFS